MRRFNVTDGEVNIAVARKLGWIIDKTSDYLPWYGRPNGQPLVAMVRELPAYSTSIEVAWAIVEFTKTKGLLFQLDNHQDAEHDLWTAEFINSAGEIEADDSADAASLAICNAFLKLQEDR
jgi:hypothetical protein